VPEQNHTHQIRRHLAAIGHPLLGDDRYGHAPTNRYFEEKQSLDRVFLHCVRIEVDHPTAGTRLVVEAPVPGDLRTVLERLSGPGTLRFLDQKNALGTAGASSLPPPPLESQRPPPDDAPPSARSSAEDDARPSFVPEPQGSRTSLTPGLVGGDAEDGEKL
jgi:23S rRNA (uracil1939-C5)-methyltransferase